jgi:hypothetical protein
LYVEAGGRSWTATATLAQDVGSGHEGAYLDLGVARRGRLGAGSGFYAVGPVLRVGDTTYKDAFFGVSEEDSIETGLPQYSADGNLERVGLQGLVSLPIGRSKWRFTTLFRASRLLNDAADSPIVVDEDAAVLPGRGDALLLMRIAFGIDGRHRHAVACRRSVLAPILASLAACGDDMQAAVARDGVAAGAAALSAGDRPDGEQGRDLYEYRPGSRDGIGKWYMGREISHVMGHLGASWLERPARERQERTDLLISRLPVERDCRGRYRRGNGLLCLPHRAARAGRAGYTPSISSPKCSRTSASAPRRPDRTT